MVGPIRSLALSRAVFIVVTTRAHAQLRPGKRLVATKALAHFDDLLSCSAVKLLQTGAWEALGHEFHDVSAVITTP